MKKTSILTIPAITCLAIVGCNKDESAVVSETAPEETPAAVETATPTDTSNETLNTCNTLGQYFAFSTSLHDLDFTAEEKAAIVEGFRAGLEGGLDQETMQANMAVISEFLQGRHQAKAAELSEGNKKEAAAYIAELKEKGEVTFTESGLGYLILEKGEGELPTLSDAVAVNYRGTLIDGTVFDEAMDPENPITFPLGGVIPGFSEGLQLIGKGGKIQLYIPSDLGYGDNPRPGGPIGPGSMLIFEVTMQDIQTPEAPAVPEDAPPPPPPIPTEEPVSSDE